MAVNIPVPINELPRVGSLNPSFLFITEQSEITKQISWSSLLADLTDLPDTVIYGYGSAELPSIGFVDSSAGFFAPQLGAIAVETSNQQRFTIGPSGVIEFGLNGVDDKLNKITSESTIKCRSRFNEDLLSSSDIKVSGDVVVYGQVNFEDITIDGVGDGNDLTVTSSQISLGTDCATTTFHSYNETRSYCNVKAIENVITTNDLLSLSPLNLPNITVTGQSTLQKVETPSNLVVDDGGVVTFDKSGILTTTGDVTAGKIFGDGQNITNLNLPSSLRLKGSIDPTTTTPPDPPADGDVWYSTATGNFTTGWVGVEGDAVRVGQSFYYKANPTSSWILGGISDLQSPYFMLIDLDQTVTGSHTHQGLIRTTDNIDTGGADILAESLGLNGKATSALTVSGNSSKTMTTKSYVESRMIDVILDFPLKPSKYIIGQSYNGSSAQTWALDTSPTGTDNLVKRNDEGNFTADDITATFLDGRALASDELDVNGATVSGDYPITFIRTLQDPTPPNPNPFDTPVPPPLPSSYNVVYSDSSFTYNPITDTLKVDNISGNVTGDITGNSDTTSALETARDIWGQSFDGTDDISGDMLGVGDVLSEGNNTKDIGSLGNVWSNVYATTFNGYLEGNVEIGDSLAHSLTNGTHILGNVWDGSLARTWSVRCSSANISEWIVIRDDAGNFSAGIITANEFVGKLTGDVTGNASGSSSSVTGNSATASTLETSRLLWSQSFNGFADIIGDINDTGNIIPQTSSTFDIGGFALKYNNLYVDTIIGDVPNNGTSTDKLSNSLGRGDYLEGFLDEWDGSDSDEWSVDPKSENTPNKTVLRDVNGDFQSNIITADFVGPITGNVSGNASGSSSSVTGNARSATKLETERDIWSHPFDGTQDVGGIIPDTGNILPTTNDSSIIGREDKQYSDVYATTFHGYFETVVPEVNQLVNKLSPGPYILGDPWDGSSQLYWNVYARSTNTPDSVVLRDNSEDFEANRITSDLVGYVTGNTTGNVGGSSSSVTGNSATITKFESSRQITVTLDGTYSGTGSFDFDGTQDVEVEIPTTLSNIDIRDLTPLPE